MKQTTHERYKEALRAIATSADHAAAVELAKEALRSHLPRRVFVKCAADCSAQAMRGSVYCQQHCHEAMDLEDQERFERKIYCWVMRLAGITFQQIGEIVSLHPQTVSHDIHYVERRGKRGDDLEDYPILSILWDRDLPTIEHSEDDFWLF